MLFMYALKSAFVLSLLYLPYTLLLSRESFFRLNRVVLLGIMLISLVLPLCNVSVLSVDEHEKVQEAHLQMLYAGVPVHNPHIREFTVNRAYSNVWEWSSIIYGMGMASVLLLRLVQLGRMGNVIRRGTLWTDNSEGVTIHCHADDVAPFSWLSNIVISQRDLEENGREIILHETGHIRCYHSLDVLLLTVVQMVQWWNPTAYLLGNSLRDVHEYEADHYTLSQGVSLQGYQQLLVKKAIGASCYSFVNGFNHSLIKRRIAMMQKGMSNSPWLFLKVLYILPLSMVALSIFATPRIMKSVEDVLGSLQQERRLSPKYLRYANTMQPLSDDSTPISSLIDKAPEYDGGKSALLGYLGSNVDYSKDLLKLGLQGTIVMTYIVEKDGAVSDIRYVDHDFSLDETYNVRNRKLVSAFEYAGIRAIQSTSGRWKPAELNGGPVRTRMFLPITFTMKQELHTSLFSKYARTNNRYSITFYI